MDIDSVKDGTDSRETELESLCGKILSVLPPLEPDAQRVAVLLYRLLAGGEAVSREVLALAAGVSRARVDALLEEWPGVYYEGEEIIGFWGLTPRPFSAHRILNEGRTAYGWCAWDTLFLPEILGKTLEVESADPETGEAVRLTVSPRGVRRVEPPGAVMSMLEPPEDAGEDIVARFCHFIHFFASPESAASWSGKHPGTRLLSLEDAFELGRRRNREQLGEALELPNR